jgi:hypothetical protein
MYYGRTENIMELEWKVNRSVVVVFKLHGSSWGTVESTSVKFVCFRIMIRIFVEPVDPVWSVVPTPSRAGNLKVLSENWNTDTDTDSLYFEQ